jgi:hypothetical protein
MNYIRKRQHRRSVGELNVQEVIPQASSEQDTRNPLAKKPMLSVSPAYRVAALAALKREADDLIRELGINEPSPLSDSNIVEAFIAPELFQTEVVGSLRTKNFSFSASKKRRLCYIERWYTAEKKQEFSESLRTEYTLPIVYLNTNAALKSSLDWLGKAEMDAKGIQRDGQPVVHYWHIGNSQFVPLYRVFWYPKDRPIVEGDEIAKVSFFSPSNLLLTLRVEDERYIKRPPLTVANP